MKTLPFASMKYESVSVSRSAEDGWPSFCMRERFADDASFPAAS